MDKKPFPGAFERVDDYRWRIPSEFMRAMKVPGIIVASRAQLEDIRMDQTPQQVANVASMPGIVKYSLAMPDIHWGYGFPVGGVAAMDAADGVVSPGGIGFDINCGIRLVRSNLKCAEAKPRLESLVNVLFNRIPSGVGSRGKVKLSRSDYAAVASKGSAWAVENSYGWPEDLTATEEGGSLPGGDLDGVSDRAAERGERQLGTLGSGNHFIEVQCVAEIFDPPAAAALGLFEGQLTLMIHSGSRGFGYQICDDFLSVFGKAMARYGISVPDRQLACAPVSSEEGRRYLSAMASAANYAWANRQVMTQLARGAFEEVFNSSDRSLGLSLVYDNSHNIAFFEEHEVDGRIRKLLVHRKGATRSMPAGHPLVPRKYREMGQPVIIPGDMGRESYVLLGGPQSLEKTWGTTCHGAGRRLSRTAAMKLARGRSVIRELEKKGILVRTHEARSIGEEMPEAYKDVSEVVEVASAAGLSRRVARLVPLGVIKG